MSIPNFPYQSSYNSYENAKPLLEDAKEEKVGFIEFIRRANKPGRYERSISLRITSTAAVVIGILAAGTVGELSPIAIGITAISTIAGSIYSAFSYKRPRLWFKLVLAIFGIGIFSQFLLHIVAAANSGQLTSVLGPLATLFASVQALHAFDVPARRDLGFSLAGSATLVAIGAASALNTSFIFIIALWFIVVVWGMISMWGSMAEGKVSTGRSLKQASIATSVVLAVAFAIVISLPAPTPLQTIQLPSSVTNQVQLSNGGGLVNPGTKNIEPAQPGKPGGKIAVGGYVGFAGPLNTGLRGQLSNQIVLRVRAPHPSYWLGETFNNWDGQSWTQKGGNTKAISGPSPFYLPITGPNVQASGVISPSRDIQTFYVATDLPNLLFAADTPEEVFYPGSQIFLGPGRSIRSGLAMNSGLIYTVISQDTRATNEQLAQALPQGASPTFGLSSQELSTDLELPNSYSRVHNLALSIVSKANANTTYEIVTALENWMAKNVKYSTNIPPLPPNADSVNQFLFVTKTGFCEQISSALVVMLRTLGIPAREAVGYVPGSFNALTDLYEIKASDAHAWVQVWYGPLGWQNSDPTASVPFSTPTPGSLLLHSISNFASSHKLWLEIIIPLLLLTNGGYLLLLALKKREALSWIDAQEAKLRKASRKNNSWPAGETSFSQRVKQLGGQLGPTGDPNKIKTAIKLREISESIEKLYYGRGNIKPTDSPPKSLATEIESKINQVYKELIKDKGPAEK
ncbi:MAG: DUF3488 domain-containing protein [Acidimicrobiales bacterium]|nr:DUF3488 domain-containing protein [Acidimicrobiales bacterium]